MTNGSLVNPGQQKATAPHLEHKAEFEQAYKNYKPSAHAIEILNKTPFVPLIAPSATGRNTTINELVKTGYYHYIISDTTRPPRYNDGVLEQNGVEYFFRTEDEMLREIKNGEFIEFEIIHEQQVSGTSIREVEKTHAEGKIAITDFDMLGAFNMMRLKKDAICIFMIAPDFKTWLWRLQKRGTITPVELRRRLNTAIRNIRMALDDDRFIFVISDKVQDAAHDIDQITRLGHRNPASEYHARQIAEELYHDTLDYINQQIVDAA